MDIFFQTCFLSADLCYWELNKPYFHMDSLLQNHELYLLEPAFVSICNLFRAMTFAISFPTYTLRRSLRNDMRMVRLLYEQREFLPLLKWNALVTTNQFPSF